MPAKSPTKIECPKCEGSGKVILKEELQETLNALKKFGPTHAIELKKKMRLDITPNGVSNRLSDLFHLGLVSRKPKGQFLIYSAI